jgi:hypothetical protein
MHARALAATSAGLLLLLPARALPEDPVAALLTSVFGIAARDIDAVRRGRVVVRTIGADDRREVATLGVVRIAMTPEFYVGRIEDIAAFKRDEAILQIGAFVTPPALADVEGLTLDEADVRALRTCRPGSCGLQLSAEAIERVRADVDWRRPDARQRADATIRQVLVDHAAAYLETGSGMRYADREKPIDAGREFVALAMNCPGPWNRFPQLRRHLVEFPRAPAPLTDDLLYWSKERIGRRGVVSMTHLAVSRVADGSPVAYAIGSKQIYGAHYYDASLGLTVLLREPGPSPATWLVYFNRSRIDVFDGIFGGLGRKIVSGRARSTVSDLLTRLQGSLAEEFLDAADK